MTFFIAVAAGFVLSLLLPEQDLSRLPGYGLILSTFLAIGLYGLVSGIDLREFRRRRGLIARAATIGVVVKSILTGTALWVIFRTPYAFLYAVIVSQIDPLSVAHVLGRTSRRLSAGGRTILRAWSSFDDPVTVLLAFYVFLPLAVSSAAFSLGGYAVALGANLLFALSIWIVSTRIAGNTMSIVLLITAFMIAVSLNFMLGIALVGLFLRPSLRHLHSLVASCFIIAAVLLGFLLEFQREYVIVGVTLGAFAFMAQAIATRLVAPRLNGVDQLFLSLAQQNGITAVILALVVAQWVPQAVSVIAFAVIATNVLHGGANYLFDQRRRVQLQSEQT